MDKHAIIKQRAEKGQPQKLKIINNETNQGTVNSPTIMPMDKQATIKQRANKGQTQT